MNGFGLSECGEWALVVEFAMNHCLESVGVLLCTTDDELDVVDGRAWPPGSGVVGGPTPGVVVVLFAPAPLPLPPSDAGKLLLLLLLVLFDPELPVAEWLPGAPLPLALPPLPGKLLLLLLLEPAVRADAPPPPALLADTWPRAMAIGLGDESGDEEVREEICAGGRETRCRFISNALHFAVVSDGNSLALSIFRCADDRPIPVVSGSPA